MAQLNMCETFARDFTLSTIYLITPGYTEGSYPPSISCECDIETLTPTSQGKSLNITVDDMQLEDCTNLGISDFDTVTIRAAYQFQIE